MSAPLQSAYGRGRGQYDRRFVRKIGHVITTQDNPSLLSMMLREARKKCCA